MAIAALCGCGGGGVQARSVFSSSCSGCHTLAGEGARKPVGGDLGGYRMTVAEIAGFTKIMPTARRLSQAEVEAVSRYIWSVQQHR